MTTQHGIPPTSKNTRTPQQIRQQQKADAEKKQPPPAAPTPAINKPQPPLPPAPVAVEPQLPSVDNREYRLRYIDEIAPASFPGKLVKFDKNGSFIVAESGDEVDSAKDLVALCDETLIGWIKFSDEEGVPPVRVQGLLYDGFVMPPRESLGDLDQAKWPIGLSGQPEDPWQHQNYLVLQDRESGELYTFVTSSKTGRRAAGNLLRHYDRLSKSHPDHYPIVRLKPSGFNHKDTRIGWVPVPTFAVVGRVPKASAAIPDSSPSADMDDKIPFN